MYEIAIKIIVPIVTAALSALISVSVKEKSTSAKTETLERTNSEQKNRILELERENLELKNALKPFTEIPLTLKKGVYYDKDGNPYCAVCRAKSLFVPLPVPRQDTKKIVYHCQNCQAYFDIPL